MFVHEFTRLSVKTKLVQIAEENEIEYYIDWNNKNIRGGIFYAKASNWKEFNLFDEYLKNQDFPFLNLDFTLVSAL